MENNELQEEPIKFNLCGLIVGLIVGFMLIVICPLALFGLVQIIKKS